MSSLSTPNEDFDTIEAIREDIKMLSKVFNYIFCGCGNLNIWYECFIKIYENIKSKISYLNQKYSENDDEKKLLYFFILNSDDLENLMQKLINKKLKYKQEKNYHIFFQWIECVEGIINLICQKYMIHDCSSIYASIDLDECESDLQNLNILIEQLKFDNQYMNDMDSMNKMRDSLAERKYALMLESYSKRKRHKEL